MNQSLLVPYFSSAAPSSLLAFIELKGEDLALNLALAYSSVVAGLILYPDHTNFISSIRPFHFLISFVYSLE